MRLVESVSPNSAADLQLAEAVAEFYADPLGFVLFAYPWGQPGPLKEYDGPDEWQRLELGRIGEAVKSRGFDGKNSVKPIRKAISSGHGAGKSVFAAWIVDWIMSTRPFCKGTITANTFTQLETKTWATIAHWTKLCITSRWFEVTGSQMYRIGYRKSWFCAAQSCREENSEAFAGQHAADSTSFYLFDEASAIPDSIWAVAEGGLTDGESMIFVHGNPTRNTGAFHSAVFGSDRDRWESTIVDSRDCALTNKETIAEWFEKYGEDSDFFRVRVRGLPPRASESQFISQESVWEAQKRQGTPLPDDALVAGLDCSGGGAAKWVFRFRKGIDARLVAPIRLGGEVGREAVIAQAARVLSDRTPGRIVSILFVDSAFGSPVVERLHVLGFDNVVEVNFGGPSPNFHQENMRSYMWNEMKEWLSRALLPKQDERLESDLGGPGFHMNKRNKLVLESKEEMQRRGVASPDDGDALALTFAQQVAPVKNRHFPQGQRAGIPTTMWG